MTIINTTAETMIVNGEIYHPNTNDPSKRFNYDIENMELVNVPPPVPDTLYIVNPLLSATYFRVHNRIRDDFVYPQEAILSKDGDEVRLTQQVLMPYNGQTR